jgi:hypothetical protein
MRENRREERSGVRVWETTSKPFPAPCTHKGDYHGIAFFFPGFLFSLPVTCTWANHYYAGEAQAPLGAIFPQFCHRSTCSDCVCDPSAKESEVGEHQRRQSTSCEWYRRRDCECNRLITTMVSGKTPQRTVNAQRIRRFLPHEGVPKHPYRPPITLKPIG